MNIIWWRYYYWGINVWTVLNNPNANYRCRNNNCPCIVNSLVAKSVVCRISIVARWYLQCSEKIVCWVPSCWCCRVSNNTQSLQSRHIAAPGTIIQILTGNWACVASCLTISARWDDERFYRGSVVVFYFVNKKICGGRPAKRPGQRSRWACWGNTFACSYDFNFEVVWIAGCHQSVCVYCLVLRHAELYEYVLVIRSCISNGSCYLVRTFAVLNDLRGCGGTSRSTTWACVCLTAYRHSIVVWNKGRGSISIQCCDCKWITERHGATDISTVNCEVIL